MLPAVPHHGNTVYLLYVQNQRHLSILRIKGLEMTKPLNPFETSRMLICCWSASSLPVFCFLNTGSLTGSLWTGSQWFSYYIYVIIVHMSSHSVWHVLNCSGGWNWRKLLTIHSSGLKLETNGFSGSFLISLTGYFPVIQDNMPTVPAFRGSAVSCLPKSSEHCQRHPEVVEGVAVLLQTPPNITASGPYTSLNQSIYHLYHLDISRPF